MGECNSVSLYKSQIIHMEIFYENARNDGLVAVVNLMTRIVARI